MNDPHKSSSLRILMVAQRFPHVAGAETQALGLALELRRMGHQVRFLSTRHQPSLGKRDEVRGISIRRVGVMGGPLLKPTQLASVAGAVAFESTQYDIVHANCLSASALGATLGATVRGVPVLIKPSLGGRGGEIEKVRRSTLAPLLLAIVRRADRYACLTEEIASELRECGVREQAIELVDNGVDLEAFKPATFEARETKRQSLGLGDAPTSLFVGQLVERKGVLETIAAWKQVRRAVPGAVLLIAGEGPLKAAVEQASAETSTGIRYLGVVDDIASIMMASDVFVMPSRNESFGNAVVEALACGLPVITCRTGVGTRLDSSAGRVLDFPEPVAIAEALVDLLQAPRDHAAESARALAEAYSFERVAQKYESIYRSLLGRSSP